jgi:hypothetical protein
LVVTTALFDDISGIPSIRNQLLRARKKSQNPVFQPRIGEDGLRSRLGISAPPCRHRRRYRTPDSI